MRALAHLLNPGIPEASLLLSSGPCAVGVDFRINHEPKSPCPGPVGDRPLLPTVPPWAQGLATLRRNTGRGVHAEMLPVGCHLQRETEAQREGAGPVAQLL